MKIRLYIKYFKEFFLGKKNFLIKIDNCNYYIRPKSYDIEVLGEVHFDKLYLPTLPVGFGFDTIVDLGAYIGDFSVWAGKKYNPSKLVLVEPTTDSALLLIENLKMNGLYDKSIVVQKAIYSRDKEEISIEEKKFNQGMNRISETSSAKKVKAITFGDLLEQNQIGVVDYLKIDIEGAEKYVFADDNKNILKSRVKYIHMETHHHLGNKPKRNITYLESLGFKVKYRRMWNNLADMIEAINTNF